MILKARQKGISKIIDADQLIDCIRKSTNAFVLSHEKGATKRLFNSVRKFIDSLKTKPTTSIDSTTEISFPWKSSSYFIGTAGQKAFARGDTIDWAHLSEAAFYPDLNGILNGIEEAAEYGQIDIETTPNGRGDFYDMWQKAKSGRSSYTPIFIPWFIDDEYSVNNMTEKEKAGMSASVREMIEMPDEEFLKTLTKEEIEFKHRVDDEWASEGVVITTGMLKWRRYKIWDKGDKFFQEYPEDDVSCFLQTKGSVFSHIIVDKKRKIPLDEFETWAEMQGMTKTEQEMFKNHQMYGGVDGAEGTESGDNHSFAVIDVDPQTNQGVVIFEITNNYPIDVFDLAVSKICNKFNINLGVEKNGIGLAHVRQLTQLDVIFEEWTTSGGEGGTRPVMLSELEEAYRKDKLIETYSEAEDELRNIEYTEKKSNSSNYRAEAKKGKHDDRVFSRAIAYGMINKPRGGVTWI